ncbi:NFX1-type zinc finger-containing protein 1 isoform X2 [Amia ocellicauda]|uniref:NFX1-type zinc finger-containing protein 1 isoform X2 n=1 Tax=Amia ocellicauda TaxID=2972642 RepID=UPI0034646C25
MLGPGNQQSGARSKQRQSSGSSRKDTHSQEPPHSARGQTQQRDKPKTEEWPFGRTSNPKEDPFRGNQDRRGFQSQDRRGSRTPSQGSRPGASDKPQRRRNHSAGRGSFQPLTVVKNPLDFTAHFTLGGAIKNVPERGRPLRLENHRGQGGRHKSQGRNLDSFPNQYSGSTGDGRKPFINHRPQSISRNHNTRQNDGFNIGQGQGYQRFSGKRAESQPNLLDMNLDSSDSEQGGRSETFNKREQRHNVCLNYSALQKILRMEPSEVVMILAAPRSGLQEFLSKEDAADEVISVALEVLIKACSSRTNRENLQHLLIDVKESNFLKRILPMYVMRVGRQGDPLQREQSIVKLNQILTLHLTLISVFPASSVIDVSLIAALLEGEINYLRSTGLYIPEETENNIKNLLRIIAHLQEKKREGTLKSDNYRYLMGAQDEQGIEDFRNMSIFPTYEDIHITEKPFMRPNIVDKKFENSNIYLDTHFRLLREDFLKPLRDGISQILKFDGKDLHHGRFDDIRIYFNTFILSPICTPKGIIYRVRFDIKNLKSVNWENSKRLLFGALVCLSRDYFETMIFATVANRDVKELAHGITTLEFTEENRLKLSDISPTDTFLMVETTAFFEAYRHVLEGLQEMAAEELPMQKYIVSCDSDVLPPKYLRNHPHGYSFEALMNDRPVKIPNLAEISDGNQEASILDFRNWPRKEKLKLDDSQLKAVQMALTKELVIIQGPPGTGKTYVGLKIVKALLANAHIWRSGVQAPILVVCYTNHALDQFLEGIYKFFKDPTGLVRVGGRSTSEILKTFSLSNLRRADQFKRKLPGHLRAMYAELTDERKAEEHQIGKIGALYESSVKGVLHESVLENYIVLIHGTTLGKLKCTGKNFSHRKQPSVMMDWLGISVLSHVSRQMGEFEELDPESQPEGEENNNETEGDSGNIMDEERSYYHGDIEKATELLQLEDTAEDEDSICEVASVTTEGVEAAADLIQVTEEAELVQAERMMEGDDVQKHIQNARRRLASMQNMVLAYAPGVEEEQEQSQENYDEGWEIPKDMKKKLNQIVKQELQKTEHMSLEEAEQIHDLWALPCKERWRLYRLWVSQYRSDIKLQILECENRYQRIVNRIVELRNREDLTVLQTASIIGMTTTCAARYRKVLHDIQPKIVIVEEAAEVLEAHIVTTLTPTCEHLILIGDHQQLRPSATVYELAKNFNLEVSLFERLIRMNVPYIRLDYQHRMRPEIARLLTPHIYSNLENHHDVYLYDSIKGVSTNVFFMEHTHLEENIHEGRSHQNLHEAKFVKSLCYYLICQGYEPSRITVLTTYTGQMYCLKQIMPKSKFEGVNVCVVDRYQGEENDIIILSLVRSNLEGKVGFLKITNRICVALSRAKKGLFCIGNMSMLSRVPLWSNIMNVLSINGQIGDILMLRCENHPETTTLVSEEKDFLQVPLGGCSIPCEYRLDCGHVCTRKCHPFDSEHKTFKCMKPCPKTLCQDGHKCKKKCFEECGKCQVMVTKTMPKCGHGQQVACSVPVEMFACQMPCDKSLPCGHKCIRACSSFCTQRCPQRVTVDLECGHQVNMQCYAKQEAEENNMKIDCWVKCGAQLDCGHVCSGNCTVCSIGKSHIPCQSQCEERLICSHQCSEACLEACAPCRKTCENRCFHRMCDRRCCDPCLPCKQPCGWGCKHHQCTKLCFEPCDRPPCQNPCIKKNKKCKHPCIGMCGEPCPNKCRVCHVNEVQELFFGNEADPGARFVQLLDCSHMFEVTGFDTWMMQPEQNGEIKMKACPKCLTPIRRSVRYGPIVKRLQLNIESMKMKTVELCSEQLQNSLRERTEVERHFPHFNLSELDLSTLGLQQVLLIDKQVSLLSKLAEIKENAGLALPNMLYKIKVNKQIEHCSNMIFSKNHEISEYNGEIKRIALLAEAYALSCMSQISLFPRKKKQLVEIILILNDSVMKLREGEIKKLQDKLDSIAKSQLKILDEKKSTMLHCDIFKQNHWFKCSEGHVYYTQGAETERKRRECPDCSVE